MSGSGRALEGNTPAAEWCVHAAAAGLARTEELLELLEKYYLVNVNAMREFTEQLPELIDTMFNVESPLGRMQSAGYSAAVRGLLKEEDGGSVARGSDETPKRARMGHTPWLPEVQRVDAGMIQLPEHIEAFAKELVNGADRAHLLTTNNLSPLVASTGIWLARMGVVNRKDQPGVIARVGSLLQDIIPLDFVDRGARSAPLAFGTKLDNYMEDYIRRGPFTIETSLNEELNTPLRALKERGKVVQVSSPTQGHSGQSILLKGRRSARSAMTEQSESTLASPIGFSNDAEDDCGSVPVRTDNDMGQPQFRFIDEDYPSRHRVYPLLIPQNPYPSPPSLL